MYRNYLYSLYHCSWPSSTQVLLLAGLLFKAYVDEMLLLQFCWYYNPIFHDLSTYYASSCQTFQCTVISWPILLLVYGHPATMYLLGFCKWFFCFTLYHVHYGLTCMLAYQLYLCLHLYGLHISPPLTSTWFHLNNQTATYRSGLCL